MNRVFLVIIIFSLLVSTITTIRMTKRGNMWTGMLLALFLNMFILSTATVILYKVDVQTFHKQTVGLFGGLGILLLIFFIPVITLINYYTMRIVSFKG